MAKIARVESKKIKAVEERKKQFNLPLERTNYIILTVGVALLILGYILMGSADHPDAFISRTLSPIILVITYTVVIPAGVFYRKKSSTKQGD